MNAEDKARIEAHYARDVRRVKFPGYERAVSILRDDLAFRLWKLFHPGKSFADFYVDRAVAKLEQGGAHKTLGKRRREGEGVTEHDRQSFAAFGRPEFEVLLGFGLRPDMKTVEYGCGSLRVGQHCISHLEPDRFVGMDVTDHFFSDGLELLDPDLLAAKRPRCHVIGRDTLGQVAAWEPDFVYACGVTQHVPQAELGLYVDRICRLKKPGTRLAVFFVETESRRRLKGKSWGYPPDDLVSRFRGQLPDARIEVRRVDLGPRKTTARAWDSVVLID